MTSADVSWDVHGNLIVINVAAIVIESHIFDYFTWIGRFDICIAKDTNLDFSGNHTLLNQDTTIILRARSIAARSSASFSALEIPTDDPHVSRFDKHWEG